MPQDRTEGHVEHVHLQAVPVLTAPSQRYAVRGHVHVPVVAGGGAVRCGGALPGVLPVTCGVGQPLGDRVQSPVQRLDVGQPEPDP